MDNNQSMYSKMYSNNINHYELSIATTSAALIWSLLSYNSFGSFPLPALPLAAPASKDHPRFQAEYAYPDIFEGWGVCPG
jgi:hypothetical protein